MVLKLYDVVIFTASIKDVTLQKQGWDIKVASLRMMGMSMYINNTVRAKQQMLYLNLHQNQIKPLPIIQLDAQKLAR